MSTFPLSRKGKRNSSDFIAFDNCRRHKHHESPLTIKKDKLHYYFFRLLNGAYSAVSPDQISFQTDGRLLLSFRAAYAGGKYGQGIHPFSLYMVTNNDKTKRTSRKKKLCNFFPCQYWYQIKHIEKTPRHIL